MEGCSGAVGTADRSGQRSPSALVRPLRSSPKTSATGPWAARRTNSSATARGGRRRLPSPLPEPVPTTPTHPPPPPPAAAPPGRGERARPARGLERVLGVHGEPARGSHVFGLGVHPGPFGQAAVLHGPGGGSQVFRVPPAPQHQPDGQGHGPRTLLWLRAKARPVVVFPMRLS